MSKKKYIELAPLIQITSARMDNLRQRNSFFDHYSDGYNECIDRIMEQPAADVAEVRHGEWKCTTRAPKRVDGYYHWGAPLETIFVCSECGRAEKNKEPYCNCGAKMDGGGGK